MEVLMKKNNESGFFDLGLVTVTALLCIFGAGVQINTGEKSSSHVSRSNIFGTSGNVESGSVISWLKGEDFQGEE